MTETKLFIDEHNNDWRLIERDGGSISLYAAVPPSTHAVIYDSLTEDLNQTIHFPKVIEHLRGLHESLGKLFTAIDGEAKAEVQND